MATDRKMAETDPFEPIGKKAGAPFNGKCDKCNNDDTFYWSSVSLPGSLYLIVCFDCSFNHYKPCPDCPPDRDDSGALTGRTNILIEKERDLCPECEACAS